MYSQVFGEGRGWREDRGREGEVKGKWGRVVWGVREEGKSIFS